MDFIRTIHKRAGSGAMRLGRRAASAILLLALLLSVVPCGLAEDEPTQAERAQEAGCMLRESLHRLADSLIDVLFSLSPDSGKAAESHSLPQALDRLWEDVKAIFEKLEASSASALLLPFPAGRLSCAPASGHI